jgi:hypothetical protein
VPDRLDDPIEFERAKGTWLHGRETLDSTVEPLLDARSQSPGNRVLSQSASSIYR